MENFWQQVTKQIDEQDLTLALTQASVDKNILIIKTPNDLVTHILQERYTNDKLVETAKNISHQPIQGLKFVVDPSLETKSTTKTQTPSRGEVTTPRTQLAGLNPEYTFEAFVVGESNRFAYKEALHIASKLGEFSSNPFFIYADVGLGKTHLLQAIGNYIAGHHPDLRVLYTPTQNFVGGFVQAIKEDTTERFRDKYRQADVLLIDDVHTLAGKEKTQEEFFGLFNDFFLSHKQMALSSDRRPGEIPNIAERIISRFQGGVLLPIYPPEKSLRTRILQKELEDFLPKIPNACIELIADRIDKDIRKLKGVSSVLRELIIVGEQVTLQLVDMLVEKELGKEMPRQVSTDRILKESARYFGLQKEDLLAKDRDPQHDYARQVAMYLACKLTKGSFTRIAEMFARESHSTIIRAYDKIKSMEDKSPTKEDIRTILKSIYT